jgi:protein gp37
MMGVTTGIEWTDATWNPLRGCSRVSEGCRNCYAERVAFRFRGPGQPYEGLAVLRNGQPGWAGKVELVEKHLLDPLKWKPVIAHLPDCKRSFDKGNEYCGCTRPRRIFVNSMSDLFHELVPDAWIDRIFAVMALCPQHTFQVLTKRPERMRDYLCRREESGPAWRRHAVWNAMASIDEGLGMPEPQWPLPNVWLGVSVENQAAADERIPLLLKTPAAVRFVSAEPLLGAVDMTLAVDGCPMRGRIEVGTYDTLAGSWWPALGNADAEYRGRQEELPHLDWVICGGESGPGARPMHPDWARSLRDQCKAASVPFFFKQWGEWARTGSVDTYGRVVDGVEIKGRKYPNSEGVSMLRDGRVCLKDFTVEEHRLRMKSGEAYSSAAITVDAEALRAFHASLDSSVENELGYEWMYRVGKHAAGAQLDGVEYKQFPEAR